MLDFRENVNVYLHVDVHVDIHVVYMSRAAMFTCTLDALTVKNQ